MDEPKKPLAMFLAGLAIVGFLEFLRSGTGVLYPKSYAIGVAAIACSVFYGAVSLAGDRRLHDPRGLSVGLVGLAIGSIATWMTAARLLAML